MAKKKNENPIPEEKAENTAAETAEVKAEEEKADERDAKIAALEAEVKSEKDKYLRLAAEYDNFRKRSAKEREGLYADVRCDTILKMLPVYDNLLRALAQPTEDEAYKKGVEMTMNQFNSIFEKLGVKPIEAMGQKFDPNLHNAVMHVEDDTVEEGVIVQEYEKGFTMGEKVIRYSVVVVAN